MHDQGLMQREVQTRYADYYYRVEKREQYTDKIAKPDLSYLEEEAEFDWYSGLDDKRSNFFVMGTGYIDHY